MSDTALYRKFSSWQDLILADDKMERLNKNTDAVVAITDSTQNEHQSMVLDYLKDDPHIVLLSVEQVTRNISLLHHIQEVSGGIGSNVKVKACMKGWGTSATALELDDGIFSDSILTSCPKKDDLWAATSSDGFKGVEPESGVRGRNL